MNHFTHAAMNQILHQFTNTESHAFDVLNHVFSQIKHVSSDILDIGYCISSFLDLYQTMELMFSYNFPCSII